MNKTEFLKLAAVALISSGLVIGCASDSTEEVVAPVEEAEVQKGPNAAAKNAIYSAKVKLARAEKLGYAWRDTAQLIKDAEKAAAAGNNDEAVRLANQAAEQAEDAIAQHNAEAARYAQNHGEVTAGAALFKGDANMAGRGMMTDTGGSYTVIRGDNLWNISGQSAVYNNPYQWPLIYKANSDQINDADLIFPGQEFSIPVASGAGVDAAIMHAKTRGAWSVGEVEASDREYLAQ